MQNHLEDPNSTELLVNEAKRRGITVIDFPDSDQDTFIFELNGHREPICFSRTDYNGTVTNRITNNKFITAALLRRGGFPVPDDLITNEITEAETFLNKHKHVVAKPISNTGGTGITTDVTTPELLRESFKLARDLSFIKNDERKAVFQQFVAGQDYRVLVINKQHTYSIHRIPAHVIGDGIHTVTQLAKQTNIHRKPECQIELNTKAERQLRQQSLTFTSVPKINQHVRLAGVANYHSGGTLSDATDVISQTVKLLAIEVAKYFKLAIVGIDFISEDITKTPGYIIELNATPDLTIHHFPDEGQPRDPAAAVLDFLFPETAK